MSICLHIINTYEIFLSQTKTIQNCAFHPPNSLTPRCWATEEIKPAQDLRSEMDLSRVDDSLLTRDSNKSAKDSLGYRENLT